MQTICFESLASGVMGACFGIVNVLLLPIVLFTCMLRCYAPPLLNLLCWQLLSAFHAATSSSFHFSASHSLEHHWYRSTLLLHKFMSKLTKDKLSTMTSSHRNTDYAEYVTFLLRYHVSGLQPLPAASTLIWALHSLEHHWYRSTLLLLGIVPHHTKPQPTVRLQRLLPPLARLPLLPLPRLRLPAPLAHIDPLG